MSIFSRGLKQLATFGVCAALTAALPMAAAADHIHEGDYYEGGWYFYGGHPGDIILGDGNGWGLDLTGTQDYCGAPGTSYHEMNAYIESYAGGFVPWEIDALCSDGYVRICIPGHMNDWACSTYIENGWVELH